MQKLPETERKRNCLCVRWDDEEMKLVNDEAYALRTSNSALVRGIVIGKLQSKEVSPEPKQNA